LSDDAPSLGRADAAVIDGWAHCGIRRFRPIEDVLGFLDRVGIDQAVLVQPLGDDDNDYLVDVSATHRDRVRSVGVVAGDRPDRATVLDRLAAAGCSGVRMTAADLISDPVFAAEAAEAGLVIAIHTPDGVSAILPIAGWIGSLGRPVVITHLGMPTLKDGVLGRGAEILAFAEMANVHILFSGFAMAALDPYRALIGLIRDVNTAFGPDRILWGSNYPLADGPEVVRDLQFLRSGPLGLTEEAFAAMTATNARRLWFESPSG